jgi:hypothetical protein
LFHLCFTAFARLQGKLEAMPMAEAVSVLEAAWSTAYKVIGSGSADVRTIDMITGEYLTPGN